MTAEATGICFSLRMVDLPLYLVRAVNFKTLANLSERFAIGQYGVFMYALTCVGVVWRPSAFIYNPRTQESSCEGNRITNSHTFQFLSYITKENGNPIMWRFYMNVNDSALLLFWHPHLFRFDLTLLFSFRKGEYNKSRERRRSSFRLFCFNLTCAACSWRFPRSLSPTDSINRYVV